eukprot:UN24919
MRMSKTNKQRHTQKDLLVNNHFNTPMDQKVLKSGSSRTSSKNAMDTNYTLYKNNHSTRTTIHHTSRTNTNRSSRTNTNRSSRTSIQTSTMKPQKISSKIQRSMSKMSRGSRRGSSKNKTGDMLGPGMSVVYVHDQNAYNKSQSVRKFEEQNAYNKSQSVKKFRRKARKIAEWNNKKQNRSTFSNPETRTSLALTSLDMDLGHLVDSSDDEEEDSSEEEETSTQDETSSELEEEDDFETTSEEEESSEEETD